MWRDAIDIGGMIRGPPIPSRNRGVVRHGNTAIEG
jgi:hypothetical protein